MMSSVHLEEALKIDATVLDIHSHISKLMAQKYNFGGYGIPLHIASHQDALMKGVSKALNAMTPATCEETDAALRKHWTESTEWREVKIMEACADVVGQITNRMLVGFPLCRDDEYLRDAKIWSRTVLKTAWIIYMTPEFLQPILAPIMALPNLAHHHRALKHVIPVAQKRLEDRARRANDPGNDWKEPLDYMKFLLDEGADAFDHVMDHNATTLARGALMVNAAAFHATGLTLGNLLLDVFSSPQDIIEGLREECVRIRAEHGFDSKSGLSKMIRVDSAIRESMRIHVLGIKAMHRYVKPKEGYTFSNGDHLPHNAHISLPVLGRHLDEAVYPNPLEYDAFRFSRDREGKMPTETRVRAAVNTSADHLAWGIGKSQCPGRFFAVDELKLILAHVLLDYEVEHIEHRPANVFMSSTSIPPLNATIRYRRRNQGVAVSTS